MCCLLFLWPCDHSLRFFFYVFCLVRFFIVVLIDLLKHYDHLLGKSGVAWSLCLCLIRGMCIVCQGLSALPFDIIGKLCYVIVGLPRHLLYYLTEQVSFYMLFKTF